MRASYLQKEPNPAPAWVAVFMATAHDESLDAAAPTETARLVAEALVPPSSSDADRARWVHRFAVALDADEARLREFERHVSPQGPIADIANRLHRRVDHVMRGRV